MAVLWRKGGLDAPRSLRLKLGVAVLAIVGSFSVFVVLLSNGELEAAQHEAAKAEVLAIARSFNVDLTRADLGNRDVLRQRASELRARNPNLHKVNIYALRDGRGVRLVSTDLRGLSKPVEEHDVEPIETGVFEYEEEREDGEHEAELNYPLRDASSTPFASLGLYYDLGPLDAALGKRERKLAVAATITGLVAMLLVAYLLGRFVFAPLSKLRAATQRIRGGDVGTRLGWSRADELGILARDFDSMAEAVEERERLEALALRDSLTGLANHRHFHEVLLAETERAARDGGYLSVIVLDLDHFKQVNDKYGHPHGDEVLRAAAKELKAGVRVSDLVARLGGEEFALILPGTKPDDAFAAAEAIRAAVARVSTADFVLTSSAGVACYPTHAGDASTLLEFADGALYWAKRSGRNQTRCYDPHHVTTRSTAEQRSEIATLLADSKGLDLEFQPLVDLRAGTIAGYEALARFGGTSPRPPDAWFAQAHRCGLGAELEAKAIMEALQRSGRPEGSFLTLNLSPSAVRSSLVQSVLPEDLSSVVIEMTEHELLVDDAGLEADLAALRTRGARIAVDDAGAGYSGLHRITRLRPDLIKLDRSIVDGVSVDPPRAALIECFVLFAHRTGAEVCAEGVESLDDLIALARLGVTYAQGFALARPALPWAEVTPLALEVIRVLAEEATDGEDASPGLAA